jgi:hypothetical protein
MSLQTTLTDEAHLVQRDFEDKDTISYHKKTKNESKVNLKTVQLLRKA